VPEISDITPSAQQASDRLLVRRGAAPPHTLELLDAMPESPSLVSMATNRIKGRTTAGSGVAEDLTPTQVTALLDVFTSLLKGLVPASAGGVVNFLRADGTWAPREGVIAAAPATDQFNWNPAGFDAHTGLIKAQPTTNSFITGIVAGAADQEIELQNDSAFLICIERESATSTAANRIRSNGLTSIWLLPNETITLRYSATLARWLVVAQSKDVYAPAAASQLFQPNTTTSVQTVGQALATVTATISNTGPPGTASEFDEYGHFNGTNSTASGTSSVRSGAAYYLRGNNADRRGFLHVGMVRFTALGATGAVRAGMLGSTAVSTTLNASLTNCLLLGADAGMTNLRIFYNDASGAAAAVDLGANFPTPGATAAYEYAFYAPAGQTYVRYMVRRLDTRFVAEGSLLADLPVNTTALAARVEAMVGATAVANTWQCARLLTVGL
jgi:hypothetical protein